MSKRLFKQIVYGLFFLLFWSGVGTLIYFSFFTVPPSCMDNKKNGNETGVDCGGSCIACEVKTLMPLEVLNTKFILNPRALTVDLLAQIKNGNLSWGLQSFQYDFTLFDDMGNVVKVVTGQSFIMPGEIKYLIDADVQVAGNIARIEVHFGYTPDKWIKVASLSGYALPVRSVNYRKIKPPEFGFAALSGVVKNTTSFTWPEVNVYGVLLDKNSNVVSFAKTQVRTLLSGEERFFTILWPEPLSMDIANWQVKVETNFYSNSTFVQLFQR